MLEKREEVICGFEMLDMGGAGVRDQCKWVVLRESMSEGHPFGEGIKDVTEGFLKFFPGQSEVEMCC
jgi:hypothetical protein